MKKKIIVSVFVFSLVIVLTIGVASFIKERARPSHDPIYVTTTNWVEEVGYKSCKKITEGIPNLKFIIKGNKGGILIDFYYKNFNKISKKDRIIFQNKLILLSEMFVLNLVSYGIEYDNANCIINVRTKELEQPVISLIDSDLVFFIK